MRSPLETDAVVDGDLSRKSSHRLWCKSVRAVREKCDEKMGVGWAALSRANVSRLGRFL
jgi:hypothetical protein